MCINWKIHIYTLSIIIIMSILYKVYILYCQYTMLTTGSVCGDNKGYCDVFYTCRIVDADGPIARLGNYIFNGVLFNQAEFIAKQYWYEDLFWHTK